MTCCGVSCFAFLTINGYVCLTGGVFPYRLQTELCADFKDLFVVRHLLGRFILRYMNGLFFVYAFCFSILPGLIN